MPCVSYPRRMPYGSRSHLEIAPAGPAWDTDASTASTNSRLFSAVTSTWPFTAGLNIFDRAVDHPEGHNDACVSSEASDIPRITQLIGRESSIEDRS
jgi:hypothetical protein